MGIFDSFFKKVQELDDKFSETVSFKCPNCGAQVSGKENKKSLPCEFCGCIVENPKYRTLLNKNESFEENKNSDFAATKNSSQKSSFDKFQDDEFERRKRNQRMGRVDENDKIVYAWVEKNGLFYEGEIPGISFSSVRLESSYSKCVDKLKEKFYEQKSKAFYKAPEQDLEAIEREHPAAKIIVLE